MPLDFDSVAAAGSLLGTRALQIFDETTSVVRTTLRWIEFYKHESCGKCTPCREGNWWLVQMLKKFEAGAGGPEGDIEKMLDVADNIGGRSFCALADGAVACVTSAVKEFRSEFEAGLLHARVGAVPLRASSALFSSAKRSAGGQGMSVEAKAGAVEKSDLISVFIDGIEVQGAEGHTGDPCRGDDRHGRFPASATTRCSTRSGACRQCMVEVPDMPEMDAASPSPRRPAPSRWPPNMQMKTQLSSSLSPPSRRRACSSSCSSTTRSTARSATRAANARCRIRRSATVYGRVAVRRCEADLPQARQRSPRRSCSTASAACCARAAPASPSRSRVTRSSPWSSAARCSRSASTPIDPYDSYFSGNVVQICPVGALTSADYRFQARPFDLVSTPTTCEICAAGCQLRTDHRHFQVKRRLAGNAPEVNEEWNCDRGRFAFTSGHQADRLTDPADPRRRRPAPASWPEAIDAAVAGLEGRRRAASAS
jgi:hypothetical protein